ncbi:MAG: tRNA lysidine(34) synthetase TilS [Verrucomicrobiota bacterium]
MARLDAGGLDPRKLKDFPVSRRYLIGVSGGRDSIALLHALSELGYGRLVVCHLNHQLRGRASGADARFVQRFAAGYDVELVVESIDVRALAATKKMSVETAARHARYSFFARIAKRKRCRTVFLAHHADDLAETLLINLFRGAGGAGLSGMREIATRRIDGVELTIVRPFLDVWRSEIDEYVRRHRLKFREDASNQDLTPLRNRVRHRIIPYIEKQFGRKVRPSLWRAAAIAADEREWMDECVQREQPEAEQLDAGKLRVQPRALQRRIIQKWLQFHAVENLDFELIERVRALLDPTLRPARTNLPRGRYVRRRAQKIFIE